MPFATINPATGETEKEFPAHTPAEVEANLATGHGRLRGVPHTTYAERARHLITAAELLEGEVPDVARMLTTEMGKTFAAAKGEVAKCAAGLRWFAEHGEALLADEEIGTAASRSYVHYQPIGAGAGHHAVELPALAGDPLRRSGPHGGQRRSAQARLQRAADRAVLEDLFRRAGLPDGCFTNLLVESKDVAAIIEDPRVAAVTLTGSERAGMSVAATAGHALKKTVLELGGSDPFIVLGRPTWTRPCAPPSPPACRTTGSRASRPSGSSSWSRWPTSSSRRFTAAMDALVVGDPFDPATNVGPIVTEAQRDELVRQIDTRQARGRRCTAARSVPDRRRWWFAPAVLVRGDDRTCRWPSRRCSGPWPW